MSNALIAQLDTCINEYDLLTHPFFQRLTLGHLGEKELRIYASEFFQFVRALPTFISAVHSNCKDYSIRLSILERLVECERGRDGHISEEELWDYFCRSMGIFREELLSGQDSATTKKLLLTYRNLCHSSSCVVGAAALYAYESRTSQIAESMLVALQEFYDIEDNETLSCFREQAAVGARHANIWASLLMTLSDTEELELLVEESARKASKALWEMLDGVCEKCGIPVAE